MDSAQWFYQKNGQQHGPIDTDDLSALIRSGALPPDTPVFTSTQTDWRPAHAIGIFPMKATTPAGLTGWRIAAVVALLLLALGIGRWLTPAPPPTETLKISDPKTAAKNQPRSLQLKAANPLLRETRELQMPARPDAAVSAEKIAQYDQQIAQAKIDLLQAEQQLREVRQFNAKLQAQIKNLENGKKPDPQTLAQLAEANAQRRQLQQRLSAASLLNAELRGHIEKLSARKIPDPAVQANLAAQLREATAELEAANQKISSLQQQLGSVDTAQPEDPTPSPVPASPDPIPNAPANALGQVANVDAAKKTVVINRGTDHGIKTGNEFRIISHATGEFLGRITIRRTRPTFAIGTLDGLGINRLQPGDLLYR